MVVDDLFSRSSAGTLEAIVVKFLCHDEDGDAAGGFPKKPCRGGIRTRLILPSHSNSELDSLDHKSHMRTLSEVGTAEDSKTRTPKLLYERVWQTQDSIRWGRMA